MFCRLKIIIPLLVALTNVFARPKSLLDSDSPCDISSSDRDDYNSVNQLFWRRYIDIPFIVHNNNGQQRVSGLKRPFGPSVFELKRERRNTNDPIERITGTKNIRESRLLGSPESWMKQPAAVQFRQPTSLDTDNFDAPDNNDDKVNLPLPIRAHYAPKTEFVTSSRARSFPESRHLSFAEGKESRDTPIARSYDDYEVPIFRNIVREHDFDVQLPRNYYYPGRYRSQVNIFFIKSVSIENVKTEYMYKN